MASNTVLDEDSNVCVSMEAQGGRWRRPFNHVLKYIDKKLHDTLHATHGTVWARSGRSQKESHFQAE